MNMSELDPTAVREVLERHLDKGSSFDVAWLDATGHIAREDDGENRRLRQFMERHFRAAYYATPSSLGRFDVPERDVSLAIAVVPTPAEATERKSGRCRSGDDCDRPATRGRFGINWCEHHGAELARLAAKLVEANAAADYRVNRNAVRIAA